MSFQYDSSMSSFGDAAAILAVLTAVFNLITMIFWILIGWRAMRAHEQVVEVLRNQTRR